MSEQGNPSLSPLPHPVPSDFDGWNSYWQAMGQSWRTQPEIDEERQRFLAERRGIVPDTESGIYPFKDVTLTRGDVEWILATLDDGRGPVDPDEPEWGRQGIDVRGANMRALDLSYLPLTRMQAGYFSARSTPTLREMAAAHLEEADFTGTHLESADLTGVHLEAANLTGAYLEGASLVEANLEGVTHRQPIGGLESDGLHLEGANLSGAHFEGADLSRSHLEGSNFYKAHLYRANLVGAHLEGANLSEAHLEGANLSEAHLEGAIISATLMEEADLRGAHLEGADLRGAHLEGADLRGAHLEGGRLLGLDTHRIRRTTKGLPEFLLPANLQGAFLDPTTNLEGIKLGTRPIGSASVADVRWGGVNLAVVDWSRVTILGDEMVARHSRTFSGARKDAASSLAEYRTAVRAYRQLSTVLREQGLHEEAARFSYRGHLVQRQVTLRQRKYGQYLGSVLLDALTGYGYKPIRTLLSYLVVILSYAAAYLIVSPVLGPHLSIEESVVISVTSFHGRGFFPFGIPLSSPIVVLAASEAVIGLLIEVTFIVTFTQRFFAR